VQDFTSIRREYSGIDFLKKDLAHSPFEQFSKWFKEASVVRIDDVSSMTLATANSARMPSARIVLLKHFDERGFCWYTDYESSKGQDLAENPQAELMFYWYGLDRQVRIQGRVEKLSEDYADKYFSQRPIASQISAAASHQSKVVGSRESLQKTVNELQLANEQGIERPARWGGYRLIPSRFEFWQGREGRLHDRLIYSEKDSGWLIDRLQP
jgi:pyridoxamine 5'-phosphate oxidase